MTKNARQNSPEGSPSLLLEPVALTVKSAAQLLGISKWAVYRLIRNGDLTAHRLGPRSTVVRLDAIRFLLDAKRL